MNPPIYYDFANAWQTSKAPTATHPRDNMCAQYYTRYLLKRAMSLFKWELPEYWDKDYFLYTLYCFGYVAVVNTNEFGVIPQYGALSGYDVFFRPRKVYVTNPVFSASEKREYNLRGDKPDGALIKLQPDYSGLMDVCGMYAERLAYCHEALVMNLGNSKLSYVFMSDNKAAQETFKRMFDKIQQGDPAVMVGGKLKDADGKPLWEMFTQNLKQNYIATDIINDMRGIMAEYDSFIGIPSANTTKRERLITDEVNANNTETETLIDLIEQTLTDTIKHCNNVFGLNLSAERRYKEGGRR